MKIIDMHTHAFPDSLAPRAIAALEAECPWKAVGRGTIDALLESMDAAGVDASVMCCIATKPDQVEKILPWCEQIRSERIIPLPSVHPKTPKPAEWIARFAEAGFPGIKMHPMYQDYHADDPLLAPIYAALSERRMLLEVHCGRDIAFPPDDDRATPRRFANVIERFPELRLVCTHLGGWRMWEESSQLILGRNVYVETSFSLNEVAPERAADMIRRHGAERILFGTDWPWQRQDEALENLRGLGLTEEEMERICWKNAEAALNPET